MPSIRLDRFLSNQAGLTRSESREMLKSLRVRVNGRTEKNYDYKINTDKDRVELNGEEIRYSQYVYLLMNKPRGVITATEDKRQKTVLDLVPQRYKGRDLSPVGRLDKDTTGALLITDDGVFAHKVISPKSGIEKEYIAVLDGDITDDMVAEFANGVTLVDGTRCLPAVLKRVGECTAAITISEGKYHQIKRMFGTVGLGVNELKRVRIGNLCLCDDLQPGELIEVDMNTVLALNC